MKDNTKALILGLCPLASLLFGTYITNLIIPLILWLVWKDESPIADKTGRKIINIQISSLIWLTVAIIICTILTLTIIGIPLAILIALAAIFYWMYITIMPAIKIANGDYDFQVPFTFEILSTKAINTSTTDEHSESPKSTPSETDTEQPSNDREVITPEIVDEPTEPNSDHRKEG